MKYKISKESELGLKLLALKEKILKANEKAMSICLELGGEKVATNGRYLGGDIAAIRFSQKPEGWEVVGEKINRLYFPKADNKVALEKLEEVTPVELYELNNLLGFNEQSISYDKTNVWIIAIPTVLFERNIILVHVKTGCKYQPVADMIEILDSDYQALKTLD